MIGGAVGNPGACLHATVAVSAANHDFLFGVPITMTECFRDFTLSNLKRQLDAVSLARRTLDRKRQAPKPFILRKPKDNVCTLHRLGSCPLTQVIDGAYCHQNMGRFG